MGGPATLVVADAHTVIREGLAGIVAGRGIEVVGAAATGEEACALIAATLPAVALVALNLPDLHGFEVLRRLLAAGSRAAVIVHLEAPSEERAAAALRQGAAGAIAKTAPLGELVKALRTVAAGSFWFEGEVEAGAAVGRLRTGLSRTEHRVLGLLSEGTSTDEIAAALHVSPHTVRSHVKNLLRKLGAQSRAHAVAIGLREHLLER